MHALKRDLMLRHLLQSEAIPKLLHRENIKINVWRLFKSCLLSLCFIPAGKRKI